MTSPAPTTPRSQTLAEESPSSSGSSTTAPLPPLRLLFVVANLASGGAERQIVTLARTLAARGHHLEFVTYNPLNFFKSLLEESSIPVHCHAKSRKVSWSMLRRLRRLMRTGHFDVALSYMGGPNLWTILAALGLRQRPKVVVSERSSASTHRFKHTLVNQTYRFADHLAVNSFHLRDYYAQQYGWIRPNISCIWNGVDLDRFQPTPLPAWQDPLKLLAVGRIERRKNWHCLVDALAILRDDHQIPAVVDHAGLLAGHSPDDQQYLDEVNDRIAALGLSDSWHWLGEQAHIERCLAEHHALVHPSSVEGLPNVVCEALACGRPVLVTNTLDHPRLVQEGRTGFLFEPQSAQSLTDALRRLRNLSRQEMAELGQAARLFAEQHLSTERCADEYEMLFRRLVAANLQTSRHPGA